MIKPFVNSKNILCSCHIILYISCSHGDGGWEASVLLAAGGISATVATACCSCCPREIVVLPMNISPFYVGSSCPVAVVSRFPSIYAGGWRVIAAAYGKIKIHKMVPWQVGGVPRPSTFFFLSIFFFFILISFWFHDDPSRRCYYPVCENHVSIKIIITSILLYLYGVSFHYHVRKIRYARMFVIYFNNRIV